MSTRRTNATLEDHLLLQLLFRLSTSSVLRVFCPHSTTVAGKSLHGMEKQLLLVANAHMHWDPEYSDVKLVQTMMFLSEVKNIVDKATRSLKLSSVSGETNAIPLVLCADLNSLPDSGKYRLNHVPHAHSWLYLVSIVAAWPTS